MYQSGLLAAAALLLTVASAQAENVIDPEGLRASPNSVKIDAVTAEKPGYVVVHETDQTGATAGEVIGFARIHEGENSGISIPLGKKMKQGAKLIVMLHEESNGDETFDAQDAAVSAGTGPVQETVTVE
jgi:hypothetical protein